MAKKELSEKQKEILAKNNFKNKPRAERSALGAKGAQKTNQIKKEKIKRENSKDWTWDKYGTELIEDIVKNGSTKDKVELVKTLLPNDKQINELAGSLGIEKIFITQEEKNATDKHIDDFINDTTTE